MPSTFPSNATAGGSSLSSSASGGVRLAPDLDLPSRLLTLNPFEAVLGIDASSGPVEALGLAGKWAISLLEFQGLPVDGNVTIQLTVDGLIIWNDTSTPSSSTKSLWDNFSSPLLGTPFVCKSSLSLTIETTTDTSVDLYFSARPIL